MSLVPASLQRLMFGGRSTRRGARVIRRVSPDPPRLSYLWQFIRGLLFTQFLLFATWNNSGYSYVGWVTGAAHFTALMAVAGIALLIAHVIVIRIAYVALGYAGILGASGLLAALTLIGWQLDLIDLDEITHHVAFWLINVASIESIGVSWARYQMRLSGERDVLKSPP